MKFTLKKTCALRSNSTTRHPLRAGGVLLLLLPPLTALALPGGGQVTGGAASISTAGATTTITQTSAQATLQWRSFNIAPGETVNFVQPNRAAVAVNRILDSNPSSLYGRLNANGQVFLLNSNGLLFGPTAAVNVGGLVASTLPLSEADFASGRLRFAGSGGAAVVNQGRISAAEGGYVALLGHQVSNQGQIDAPRGTVALAGGSAVTLNFLGDGLLGVQVAQSALDALADNGGLIRAEGGQVLLTAGAHDALLASAVNHSGVIEARGLAGQAGRIILLGGMQAGTARVSGTLDASSAQGNGGFIETSAAHVKIANEARVSTAAPRGTAGTWLIDPVDFTIAASGGDMTGAQLSASLGAGNVTIQSTSGGAGTAGDVNVNDVVGWSANRLTLNAQNNIHLNARLSGSGSASLALEYGQGALAAGNTSRYHVRAPVDLPSGPNFSTKQGSDGVVRQFTVINSLGAAGDELASPATPTLQGLGAASQWAGDYVLGSDLDASATAGWNAGAGFAPIGAGSFNNFAGTLDGLGHVVRNLTINRPGGVAGLFHSTNSGTVIRNLGLEGASVVGASAGGLVGSSHAGRLEDSHVSGSVEGVTDVGGLVSASNRGVIADSYSTGSVRGVRLASGISSTNIGGLLGRSNFGAISGSYSSAQVVGDFKVGGLVGLATAITISDSYASGSVSPYTPGAGSSMGGLVGSIGFSTVVRTYANGAVSGATAVGGLAGTGDSATRGREAGSNFWDVTRSGQSTSRLGIGLTSEQMQQQASFPSWDFNATWLSVSGVNAPLLRTFLRPVTLSDSGDSRYAYAGQALDLVRHADGTWAVWQPPQPVVPPAVTPAPTLPPSAAGRLPAVPDSGYLFDDMPGLPFRVEALVLSPGTARVAGGLNPPQPMPLEAQGPESVLSMEALLPPERFGLVVPEWELENY